MSKKHFIEIAKAINLQYAQATTTKELKIVENIVTDLCATFKNDNNLFDAKRFREACGIDK